MMTEILAKQQLIISNMYSQNNQILKPRKMNWDLILQEIMKRNTLKSKSLVNPHRKESWNQEQD